MEPLPERQATHVDYEAAIYCFGVGFMRVLAEQALAFRGSGITPEDAHHTGAVNMLAFFATLSPADRDEFWTRCKAFVERTTKTTQESET